MATGNPLTFEDLRQVGLSEAKAKWGWFVGVGALMILAGLIAIGSAVFATVFSVMMLGWMLIFTGVIEAAHSFGCKNWGGFFVNLLSGILYTVVGFMMLANPGASAVALTLLIAMFLIFGGIFRSIVAIMMRFPNWGLLLVHGIVSLVLGICIWRGWPLTGLWVIGLFVGIELLFNGITLVTLGFGVRSVDPAKTAAETGSPETASAG